MEFDVVIGLETHVELNTKTKVFCGCKNEFGGIPNTHCCPVCTGMPGSLPLLNKSAVEKTIMAGLALNCTINQDFGFERKNYFYPDLAKAYQISQSSRPICINGYVEVPTNDGKIKKVRINRIHLEEDAGKLIHTLGETYVDYNRGGVPLIETVTEPDLSSPEEVMYYLNYLKDTYKYIGVSDVKMQEGSLRCDVNVSLKPKNSDKLGKHTEMKNLNSFKAIERAIRYEINRQKEIYESGSKIERSMTLKWDDEKGINYPMRDKESSEEYRYFPEPDILTTHISNEYLEEIRSEMPELPKDVKARLIKDFCLPEYDAELISKERNISKFFFDVASGYKKYKKISNWITSDMYKKMNEEASEERHIPISAKDFIELLTIYDAGELSQTGARTIFDELWINGGAENVNEIMTRLNLKLASNDDELDGIIKKIVEDNPKAKADYKSGNQKVFAFFVGQTMKATKGQAAAAKVNEIIKKYLED